MYKYSLKSKMLVAFLTIALLPLGIMSYLDYRHAQGALTNAAYHSLYSASFQTAAAVDDFLKTNREIVRMEAQMPDLSTYLENVVAGTYSAVPQQEVAGILEAFVDRNRLFIEAYTLSDASGKVLVTTEGVPTAAVVSEKPYIKAPLESGMAYISPLEFAVDQQGTAYFYISAPIRAEDGRVLGILYAKYNAAILQQLVAKNSNLVGSQAFAMIIDEHRLSIADGSGTNSLYRTFMPSVDGQLDGWSQSLIKVDSPEPYFETELPKAGGVKMAGAIVRMSAMPWMVLFLQPKDIFLAPIQAQTVGRLYFAFVTLLFAVIAAVWVARKLNQPIHHLSQAAQQVADGNLQVSVRVHSGDEIEVLADHFSYMTEQIRLREENLQRAHDQLEQKVEERTTELYAANQELVAMNEEITAMNETLIDTNERLQQEVENRVQAEEKLLWREQQYRATTRLLTREIDNFDMLLRSILYEALELIKAPGGCMTLFDEHGKNLYIHSVGEGRSIHGRGTMEWLASDCVLQDELAACEAVVYIEDCRTYRNGEFTGILEGVSSIVMLPLRQGGDIRGVLAACWYDIPHIINNEETEILRQYGELASLALMRAKSQEDIRDMAYRDSLTGLPNRAHLMVYLEQEMRLAQQGDSLGLLLFIDLDDLKLVNDSFGHHAGDMIIVRAGQHIVEAVGPKAFVARIGGDEFVVVLPGVSTREMAAQVAEHTVDMLSHDYEVAQVHLHLSASIGVVLYPLDAQQTEDVLKKADSAMYAAKQGGRNCWRFYEAVLLQESYDKMILTNALRRAIERQELLLHYQPQLTADGRQIVGFEALLRWNSIEHQGISPARFIPLAEQSGLILPIGRWVIRQACAFARRMADIGYGNIHVAVNISPRQLEEEDFVTNVHEAVLLAGIKPSQLEIEVTESILIEFMEESIAKLDQLRSFGIKLSLDDFGTGYSSLTYLRRLPVCTLKIDKAFIDEILSDVVQRQVVGTIIDLGHTLDMTIIAEGVETQQQLKLLEEFGCDCVQGYVFSRPIPEEEAIRFLARPHKNG